MTNLAKRITASKQLNDGHASNLEAILAPVIKQLLNNDLGHLAEGIAVDLEQQGYPDAAELVRDLVARGASSARRRNPPLTT